MVAIVRGIFFSRAQKLLGMRHAAGGGADDDRVRNDVTAGAGLPRRRQRKPVRARHGGSRAGLRLSRRPGEGSPEIRERG